MKKAIYSILISILFVGFFLVIIDGLSKAGDGFNIPSRFEKVVVDLGKQYGTDVLVFTKELNVPSTVELIIQSNAANEKKVKIVSESEILGTNSSEIDYTVWKLTGNASISSTLTLDKGRYSVYVTSEKTDGKLVIGHVETAREPSEFERLYKIHNGEPNNPPKGYEEIYSTDLTGKSCKDEVIYTITLDEATNIGLSVYTSSKQGIFSVDLIGKNTSFTGLVHHETGRICDQLEATLLPGEYLLKLTCENADGWLYVFLKQ